MPALGVGSALHKSGDLFIKTTEAEKSRHSWQAKRQSRHSRDDGNPLRRRQYLIIQTMDTHLRGYDEKNDVRANDYSPPRNKTNNEQAQDLPIQNSNI